VGCSLIDSVLSSDLHNESVRTFTLNTRCINVVIEAFWFWFFCIRIETGLYRSIYAQFSWQIREFIFAKVNDLVHILSIFVDDLRWIVSVRSSFLPSLAESLLLTCYAYKYITLIDFLQISLWSNRVKIDLYI